MVIIESDEESEFDYSDDKNDLVKINKEDNNINKNSNSISHLQSSSSSLSSSSSTLSSSYSIPHLESMVFPLGLTSNEMNNLHNIEANKIIVKLEESKPHFRSCNFQSDHAQCEMIRIRYNFTKKSLYIPKICKSNSFLNCLEFAKTVMPNDNIPLSDISNIFELIHNSNYSALVTLIYLIYVTPRCTTSSDFRLWVGTLQHNYKLTTSQYTDILKEMRGFSLLLSLGKLALVLENLQSHKNIFKDLRSDNIEEDSLLNLINYLETKHSKINKLNHYDFKDIFIQDRLQIGSKKRKLYDDDNFEENAEYENEESKSVNMNDLNQKEQQNEVKKIQISLSKLKEEKKQTDIELLKQNLYIQDLKNQNEIEKREIEKLQNKRSSLRNNIIKLQEKYQKTLSILHHVVETNKIEKLQVIKKMKMEMNQYYMYFFKDLDKIICQDQSLSILSLQLSSSSSFPGSLSNNNNINNISNMNTTSQQTLKVCYPFQSFPHSISNQNNSLSSNSSLSNSSSNFTKIARPIPRPFTNQSRNSFSNQVNKENPSSLISSGILSSFTANQNIISNKNIISNSINNPLIISSPSSLKE